MDIEAAAAWYESRRRGLSKRFLATLDTAITAVHRNPYRYAVALGEMRALVLREFPYNLLYAVDDDVVVIVACFHHRRDPGELMRRVESLRPSPGGGQ